MPYIPTGWAKLKRWQYSSKGAGKVIGTTSYYVDVNYEF
jgi:hypothetical protein